MKPIFWALIILLFINLAICIFFFTYREGLETGVAGKPIPTDSSGNLPDGYYKIGEGIMAPVPFGYIASADKLSISPVSSIFSGSGGTIHDTCFNQLNYFGAPTEASFNQLTHYSTNNYNVQYHDSPENIAKQNGLYDISLDMVTVKDASGNNISIPRAKVQGSNTYYEPGTYKFGASTYVPTYEDSVYLSRTTGGTILDPKGSFSIGTKSINGGFCSAYKLMPEKLEESCNATSINNCASTSCCVLLGGEKCVAGDENGPLQKSNYSDIFIRNKDYYYYQGKCYGNCRGNP